MNITQLQEATGWTCIGSDASKTKEINGVFTGDLLSWVMGHGETGNAWITVQAHSNIIAVAVLRELSCIVVAHGARLNEDALEQAAAEDIAVFYCDLSSYQAAREFVRLGF